jgi:hypothetical protein
VGQNAVQTIFLNNASNFSIGTNGSQGVDEDGNTFILTVTADVFINGACMSFDTRGGTLAFPQSVSTTGEGGIFVDALGVFRLLNNRIASFGTMVTKSRSGVVDLPSNQAFFEPRVGIAEWQPDLSDPAQRLLVGPADHLSDYTFDWGAAKKAFCCTNLLPTPTNCFIPYDVEEVPAPCACPAVTQNNLFDLPTVQGEVDQMQILRSRMCDFVHLLVDGGFIRELVFLHGFNTGEGPFGFIVIQNDGQVGLGTSHKDVDSLEASITLGVNGVMLVPNGDGNVELNEDIIINNVCHILSGTAFGLNGQNTLAISSTTPKELRIKSTGVLDLTQFDNPNKQLEITGQVRLVCEPGARIIMNGGTLIFSGASQFFLEALFDTQVPVGTTINSTDNVRVRLSGSGLIIMTDESEMIVPENAFFGVETFPTCSTITNIQWEIQQEASIHIGSEGFTGGSFQIGDTVANDALSVSFLLRLIGPSALFQLDRQGFFGLASGIVNKQPGQNQNNWTVSCLSNVLSCSIIIDEGTFQHNQIITGDSFGAALLAIGSEGSYTFNFTPATSIILGGGNLVKINCTEIDDVIIPTSVNPTVTTFSGPNPNGFVIAGIMAGEFLLIDTNKGAQPAGVSPLALFNYLVTPNYNAQAAPKGNIASDTLNQATIGYVRDGTIIRRDTINNGTILSIDGLTKVSNTNSLNVGAVSIRLNALSQNLQTIREIIGAGAL